MRPLRTAAMLAIAGCWAMGVGAQTRWATHPASPVLMPGEPGSWDEGGRRATAVAFDGTLYHMWFSGLEARGGIVSGIGHATSPDGILWTIDPANPVVEAGPGWDAGGVIAASVIYDGGLFRMWYSAFSGFWVDLGYASSFDGSTWTKHADNPVTWAGWPPDAWSLWGSTAVVLEDEVFRMWFVGSTGDERTIGYAESPDGLTWTRWREPVLEPGSFPGEWTESSPTSVAVVSDGSMYHMWTIDVFSDGEESAVGYAFSADGIAWSRHRDNPIVRMPYEDIVSSPVVFDGFTWQMWYSHDHGLATTDTSVSYAFSDCCPGVAALAHPQLVPAAAVASGAQGAFFTTDLDLSNRTLQQVQYRLAWLPRGEDCSEPTWSETFTLAGGASVRYVNVLAEVFGLEPDALGGLLLLSTSPDLLAMSRTYNTPSGEPAGSYGQSMAGVTPGGLIRSDESRRIQFASENADQRTNVGCANGTGRETAVILDLFRADGQWLERQRMTLLPWGNDQLNRIFQDYQPVEGYVDVWTDAPDRAFYCYGSVLDNATSDPTTIPPQ